MDPDDLRGQLQRPLEAAYGALQRQQAEHHGQGPHGPPVASRAAQQEPDADRGEAVDGGDHGVALDDPFQRLGALEGEAVDELAGVGAGVRARGGGDRAGEDRQLAERDQRPHRPDAEPVARAPPLPGLIARAPGQREGRVEQHHREDEVEHHQPRGEVVLDDQGAEDRLADHPQRQQRAEQRQVPAVGPAEEGEDAGGDHGDADEPGQQPVAVLDHRVGVERRHGLAVALGPVRAAEAGAGEPHAGAGEDDQRQRAERDQRSPARSARGEISRRSLEAFPHRHGMMRSGRARPLRAQPPLLFEPPPLAVEVDQVFDQLFDFFRFDDRGRSSAASRWPGSPWRCRRSGRRSILRSSPRSGRAGLRRGWGR